jgi:hypothetical protein
MANFTARQIHKQVYPATYNSKDETDGTTGESIDWIDAEAGDDSTYSATITALEDGHRKVIKFLCSGDNGKYAQWRHTESETAQTVEWWWKYIDNGQGRFNFYGINESSQTIVTIRLAADDNKLDYVYGDGLGGNTTGSVDVASDTWVHVRYKFSCATDTQSLWVDGVLVMDDENFVTDRTATSIGHWRFQFDTFAGANSGEAYVDAYGESSDTSYNVGDNVDWRHLKEKMTLSRDFEDQDVGDTDTTITFIGSVSAAGVAEIVPEFNEHKKVCKVVYTAGASDNINCGFSTTSKSGWVELWVKCNDVTGNHEVVYLRDQDAADVIIRVKIDNSAWEIYTAGAFRVVTNGPTPVNNTWYHVFVEWYSDDTFDLWIDNVLYEDGTAVITGMTNGIDRYRVYVYAANDDVYIDAVNFHDVTGAARGDNRTFDYLAYTYDDITSNISKCIVTDLGYDGSTAILEDDTTLTINSLHFIQLYDINGDLRFEGNIKRTDSPNVQNIYPLQSFNNDALLEENSYTASSAEDVNASLLAIHTNVSQVDGRLIYYTEDDPSGNLTPNFRNKPLNMGIRWFAIHGAKIASIKANGVFMLDDDRTPDNGAATITSSSGEILGPPIISEVEHQINYVEVRGAINPDSGTPFSGISQDTTAQADGTGIKRYYKRFRELQSDTDCQNRAIQIRTGTGFEPTHINVTLRGIYAIPGEVINFAYSPLSYSATNLYVEKAEFNLVQNFAIYVLNSGIFDLTSLITPGYTEADETADDIGETLYTTDLVTVYPQFSPAGTAVWANRGVNCTNAGNDGVMSHLYCDEKVDTSRDLVLTWVWIRNDAGADSVDGLLTIVEYEVGGLGTTILENVTAISLNGCAAADYEKYTYTISAADFNAGYVYYFEIVMNEAGKDITFSNFVGRYYALREV